MLCKHSPSHCISLLTSTYFPYTILWKLPICICSKTLPAQCDLIIFLHPKSRKKCQKYFKWKFTAKNNIDWGFFPCKKASKGRHFFARKKINFQCFIVNQHQIVSYALFQVKTLGQSPSICYNFDLKTFGLPKCLIHGQDLFRV